MSTKSVAQRAKALSARTTTIIASESKVPDPTTDFLTSFKANTSIRTDLSNNFIIDLFPDTIPTVCYIIAMCAKYQKEIDTRQHAKASFPSVVYYCLTLYYAFYLANDAFVRPTPSDFAAEWLSERMHSDFIDFLLELPVPEFMLTILDQLSASEPEGRANIHVVPTMAGFDYHLFFGKFIPPIFFLNIHNVTADITATTKQDIMSALFQSPVFSVTSVAPISTNTYTATNLDFLGGSYINSGTNTAPIYYAEVLNSRWYQYFDMMFNPVLARTYQRREHLADIPIKAPTFASSDKINPYTLLFAPTRSNLMEHRVVLQALAGVLKGAIPFSKSLCDVISSASGINAFDHGYSSYSLPIMCHDFSTPGKITKIDRIEPDSFAAKIKFLQAPVKATTNNTFAIPHIEKDDGTKVTAGYSIKNLFGQMFFRLHDKDSLTDFPADTDFDTYQDAKHLFGKVYILDVSGDCSISGHMVTLSGKIIETLDIDGTTVGLPNTQTPLGMENSLFADSAIPFKMVHARSAFNYQATDATAAFALKRALHERQGRHPASHILVDRTKMLLPRYEPTQYQPTSGTTAPSLFQGFTPRDNVVWPSFALRFIGYKTADSRKPDFEMPAQTAVSRKLLVWSPYTITTAGDEDSFSAPDISKLRRYFLVNMRTIFGSNVQLVEGKHPLEALPVF